MIQTAAGLYVPDTALPVEVWRRADWKAVDAAAKALADRGCSLQIACRVCAEPMAMQPGPDGDKRLRCGCKERRLSRL